MTNLQLRILSAAVLAPVTIAALSYGGRAFVLFFAAIASVAVYEWIALARKTKKPALFLLLGAVYLPAGLYSFLYLRTGFSSGLYLVLTMLIVVWAADTGAYFIGRKFGRRKMAPSISPNKSWEGMIGAIVFAALAFLAMVVIGGMHSDSLRQTLPVLDAETTMLLLFLGGALAYIGQAGDLLESFLKRKASAKDSGRLIPGHGGVLDRIDSILLVAPFFVLISRYVLQNG
jgi:phosphatidate cytidylyltransferase